MPSPRPSPAPSRRASPSGASVPPPPPPPPAPPDTGPLFETLVTSLAEAHVGASAATLVRVGLDGDDVSLATRVLPPGVHPSDVLLGDVVPSRWVAAGVAAPATAHRADSDSGSTAAALDVGVALVVDRSGRALHHLAGSDAPTVGDDAPSGTLRDLLERSLGLPTEPPTEGPASWWRRVWLDRLVAGAADAPGCPPGWPPEVVRALVDHPAYCAEGGWRALRDLAAGPGDGLAPGPAAVRRVLTPFVDRSAAAWFDDGAFSRWLLGALPSEDDLLDAVEAILDPSTARSVREAVGPTPGEDRQ